jgi:hypothetical protein
LLLAARREGKPDIAEAEAVGVLETMDSSVSYGS